MCHCFTRIVALRMVSGNAGGGDQEIAVLLVKRNEMEMEKLKDQRDNK